MREFLFDFNLKKKKITKYFILNAENRHTKNPNSHSDAGDNIFACRHFHQQAKSDKKVKNKYEETIKSKARKKNTGIV